MLTAKRRNVQKLKKMTLWIGPLVFSLLVISSFASPPNKNITNEDIRDAILSMVHMLRAVEDKLERHEFRDRVSDDTLRKSILLLDKRVKQLDPVKRVVSRLDEWIAKDDLILMKFDERENAQLQKSFTTVEDIQKSLPTIMEKLKSDIIEKLPVIPEITLPDFTVLPDKNELQAVQKAIVDKVEGVVEAHQSLLKEFEKIKKDNERFINESRKSEENLNRIKKQLDSSEMLLQKYEHTLSELNNKIPPKIVQLENQKDWQNNFMQAFNNQSDNVKSIISDVKKLADQVELLPRKVDLEDVKNATQSGLNELKYQAISIANKSENTVDAKLKKLQMGINKDNEHVIKNINDLSEMTGSLMVTINPSCDQLKNEIAALQKVEQTMVQTADGILNIEMHFDHGVRRLNERLANVEIILMKRDERENDKYQKTLAAIEEIQKNLPTVMEELKSDIIGKLPIVPDITLPDFTVLPDKNDLKAAQNDIIDKVENVVEAHQRLGKEFEKIKKDCEGFMNESRKYTENFDRVKKQLDGSERLFQNYGHILSKLHDKIPTEIAQVKDQKDWQINFMQAFNSQSDNVKSIISDVKKLAGQVELLPQKVDLKYQTNSGVNKSESTLDSKLKELKMVFKKDNDNMIKNINDLSVTTGLLIRLTGTSFDQLKNEIASVAKADQVMVQTDILSEVAKLIKESDDRINKTIFDKFDAFEQTVLNEENGALTNLTYKIRQDIDQVWRQIGIAHQEMNFSSDTLNNLHNQTDIYISLDSMKGTVVQITNRMNEVDNNLIHLMGRLSLVSQEFNRIKDGLSGAMDQIRKSFAELHDEIKDIGIYLIEAN